MNKPRFSPEHAVQLQLASDVQVAPNGSALAFVVAPIGHEETIPVSQIWYAPIDGATNARRFTSGTFNNQSPRWSPDSSEITFLSDRAQRGSNQAHVIRVSGGEARQISELRLGVELVAWRPGFRALSVTADRRALAGEQEPLSDFTVYSQAARPRVVAEYSLDRPGSPRVLGPADGHVWSYAWRPDGKAFAALVTPTNFLDDTETVRLVLVDASTRAERILETFHRVPDALSWAPDGSKIAFVGDAGRAKDDQVVMVVDAESGDVSVLEFRETTPAWACWKDGSTLIVSAFDGLYARLDEVDVETGNMIRLDVLPAGGSILAPMQAPISLSSDGETLGVVRTNPASPPEIWAGRLATGQLRQLTNLNPQIREIELARVESIEWQASDGLRIEGWLLTPPDYRGDRRLPLIADVHGGPASVWHATFHGTWHDWGQLLAAEGYAVLLPNPRGSLGRGRDFTAANHDDLGGMDLDDVMRGIDHLIERGVADPERLGIAGWSYGGFLAAWAVAHSDRFAAAVCGAAVTNWPSKIGTTDIRPFNDERFASPLHEAADSAWDRSPIKYLHQIKTPTLVVHGEADPRVPLSQGLELYSGLKASGVPTDFITYPRQKHAFHEKAHQLDVARRIVAWFREHLTA